MKSTNTKNTKNSGIKRPPNSQVYLGIFCLFGGIVFLVNNYYPLPPKTIAILLFCFSTYLITLAIFKQIRKVYYVLGLVLLSMFVSVIIREYGRSNVIWPVIMIILSVGITAYGYLFKREKHIRYTVPGVVLFGMGLLVLFIVQGGDVPFTFIWNLWPLLLIILGAYQIYLRYQIKKIQDEFNLSDDDDDENLDASAINQDELGEDNQDDLGEE